MALLKDFSGGILERIMYLDSKTLNNNYDKVTLSLS